MFIGMFHDLSISFSITSAVFSATVTRRRKKPRSPGRAQRLPPPPSSAGPRARRKNGGGWEKNMGNLGIIPSGNLT